MSHAGQARNFESTLRGLAERGHEVHMGYERAEKKNLPGHRDLAERLVQEYPEIACDVCPRPAKDDWSWVAARLRAAVDYMRYLEPEFDNAPKLRARAERFAPERVKKRVRGMSGAMRRVFRSALVRGDISAPVSDAVTAYIRARDPDVVLVTPLLEPGTLQVEFLRAANRLGIPTCLCVASWDNLTNKGIIHEQPDAVTVWNDRQREEAARLHGVDAENVIVTGAIAYDHWFDWEPARSRGEFTAAVGLDPAKPFVLYVGSSGFIAPDEATFLVDWLRGLDAAGLDDVRVLARPHPSNPLVGDSPAQKELARFENVRLYPPAGANPTNVALRRDYFDSIYYCSAVAGVNTSAFLESAIVGRPVFTVLTDALRETQEGMLHFHHLLNAGGGLLHTSETWEDHADQLRDALAAAHPDECVSEKSRRFTEAFIRPYGLDEPATPRMLDAIEEVANGKRVRARRRALGGRLVARVARRSLEGGVAEQRAAKHVRNAATKPVKSKGPKAEKLKKPKAAGKPRQPKIKVPKDERRPEEPKPTKAGKQQ